MTAQSVSSSKWYSWFPELPADSGASPERRRADPEAAPEFAIQAAFNRKPASNGNGHRTAPDTRTIETIKDIQTWRRDLDVILYRDADPASLKSFPGAWQRASSSPVADDRSDHKLDRLEHTSAAAKQSRHPASKR
jgi:hypothetical protein